MEEPFGACVAELCPDDPQAAEALGDALEAAAHGHAMLLLDGSYGEGPDAVDRAAAQAARVTGALIQGRAALGAIVIGPGRLTGGAPVAAAGDLGELFAC